MCETTDVKCIVKCTGDNNPYQDRKLNVYIFNYIPSGKELLKIFSAHFEATNTLNINQEFMFKVFVPLLLTQQ